MFDNRYVAYLADSQEARSIHYGIRYSVYCERKGYEAPAGEGLHEERDHYDHRATAFLVRDSLSLRWQGVAPLITNAPGPLPAEEFGAVDPDWAEHLRHHRYAELSRLASLSTAFEGRMATEAMVKATVAGVFAHSLRQQLDHIVFLMAPALGRLISGMGIPMDPCGPVVNHRGRRRAFAVNLKLLVPRVRWLRDMLAHGNPCPAYSAAAAAEREALSGLVRKAPARASYRLAETRSHRHHGVLRGPAAA